MKIYVLDPLAMLGAQMGYNRPLDRHDFPHGSVPDRAGTFIPGMGEARRFANLSLVPSGASGSDMYLVGTKQLHPLGTMAMGRDGRIFRYGSAGATLLIEGNMVQSAAPIANHLALTAVAEAINAGGADDPITVTPGATAGAANLYAEGMLTIDTTPGNGYNYRISGHAAIVASTAFNLFLDPDDRLQIALTSASRYGLHHHPYKTVIQCPTTVTALNVGGVVSPIPANTTAENFGWLQTRGPFAGLINGTPAVGTGLVTSVTTAGALDAAGAVALEINYRIIARMMQVGVSGKNNTVFLTLD